MNWTDVFTELSRGKTRVAAWKTMPADRITWGGVFRGKPMVIVSTVRLIDSNLAHFLVHSGARIAAHDWNLMGGGHYVDLAIDSRHDITEEDILAVAELAAATEQRPVYARCKGQPLSEGVCAPAH